MKNDMYEMFLEQYKTYSIKELKEITVANDYTEDAEQAAKEILEAKMKEAKEFSDNTDNADNVDNTDNIDSNNYYEYSVKENHQPMRKKEHMMQENELRRIQTERDYQLHMDVHRLAGDLRFLKNVVIVLLVIYAVSIVFSIVFVLSGISQLKNGLMSFL